MNRSQLVRPQVDRRGLEAWLLDELRIRAWARLLFVQCGDGWIAEEAWRRGRKGYVCGLDTSPELVARATVLRGAPGMLEFKAWDGERLPNSSGCFDQVISLFALGCSADPYGALREMHGVLRSGGEVYLIEHSAPADGVHGALAQAGFEETQVLSGDAPMVARGRRGPASACVPDPAGLPADSLSGCVSWS